MKTAEDLRQLLDRIDHRGYPAYKDTKGVYQFQRYVLSIDHVQGDPFAAPSKLSLRVPGRAAGFLKELFDRKHKRIALQDMLIRNFYGQIQQYSFQAKGSGKSGIINVTRCSQEILERTACEINPSSGDVTVRFEVGFPANGRTINSRELKKILYDFLPSCVEKALYYGRLDKERVKKVVELAQDQEAIKSQLEAMGLVAFVANGSILPRESGVSQRPMKEAVPFVSPKSMEVTMELPYRGKISGMGIKKGVTLIVGGGYHGKSTLLKALEMGVYPHIAGDGREYVVTDPTAMKIRAEDGRSIKHTDISMFINDLPNGKDTAAFDTEDASGSTSQAANVVESIEAGAKVFLIDEDTSATNFMVRDELMQRVIHRDMEPITPFIERVRALYEELPKEGPQKPSLDRKIRSYPALKSKGRIKIKTMGRDGVTLNHETIDLRYVEQLVDSEQLVTLGNVVKHLEENVFDGKKTLSQTIEELYKRMDSQGLGAVCDGSYLSGNLAMPRKQEIYACLNRYRKLGTARR